ncbi:MAG: hypothetical protein WB791_02605, partial [Waddliaceae bacterium]
IFCLVEDELNKVLQGKKLRQRGRVPNLTNGEVITMEIVGEFLGKDCDKTIWEYFKSHWKHFFPKKRSHPEIYSNDALLILPGSLNDSLYFFLKLLYDGCV